MVRVIPAVVVGVGPRCKPWSAHGWVRRGKKHVWEIDWEVTDEGRRVASGDK